MAGLVFKLKLEAFIPRRPKKRERERPEQKQLPRVSPPGPCAVTANGGTGSVAGHGAPAKEPSLYTELEASGPTLTKRREIQPSEIGRAHV